MSAPNIDDLKLTTGLRRGEPDAWAALCEQFGVALYRYAFHLSGGEVSLAEDIRQETLLAAAESIQGFRGEAPLFGWLCAIARRKAADELRRRGRITVFPEGDDSDSAPGWTLLGRETLPEDWLEQAERRAAVVEALWCLPAEYRIALLARYAEGSGVDAIAQQLGRSYKAAESLLARARAALREKLIEVDHG